MPGPAILGLGERKSQCARVDDKIQIMRFRGLWGRNRGIIIFYSGYYTADDLYPFTETIALLQWTAISSSDEINSTKRLNYGCGFVGIDGCWGFRILLSNIRGEVSEL